LASLRGKTVRQLEREFLRNFSQTPEQWINQLRLRDAKALLEEGKKVKEVASAMGYTHLESFSRAFKQSFGVPPSEIGSMRR
jgi:AraC-like DNA-binding protein